MVIVICVLLAEHETWPPVPVCDANAEGVKLKVMGKFVVTLWVAAAPPLFLPPWVQGADVADQHLRESNFIKN